MPVGYLNTHARYLVYVRICIEHFAELEAEVDKYQEETHKIRKLEKKIEDEKQSLQNRKQLHSQDSAIKKVDNLQVREKMSSNINDSKRIKGKLTRITNVQP